METVTDLVDLVRKLYAFPYSVTGAGNEAAIVALQSELDFEVHSYRSGQTINGWLIPDECIVEKAEIRKDGDLIYDGTSSPLGVPAQSDSFHGMLDRDDLMTHLFIAEGLSEAIPYHWARLYRPDEPLWGFCMPKSLAESLPEGCYEVDLRVRKIPAEMRVLTYELTGDTPDTVLINAHNCHPFQANDDTSGVAAGIEVMRHLASLERRRNTYVLMIAPELFGPIFWMDNQPATNLSRLAGTIMLKSVGNDAPMRLQESFLGETRMDMAAHNVFRSRYGVYESGEFRSIYGNDETVFEAPPFNIPSISLTRWPFPEYHTDHDTPERLSESRMRDTVEVTVAICLALEADEAFEREFDGLVSLSRHGLYKPPPPVGADGVDYDSVQGRWNKLMNHLPRYLDGETGLLEIAERFQLPIDQLYQYVNEWVAAGLARRVT